MRTSINNKCPLCGADQSDTLMPHFLHWSQAGTIVCSGCNAELQFEAMPSFVLVSEDPDEAEEVLNTWCNPEGD